MAEKKFKIGSLTEDDLDQDYAPGRSDKTMTREHKSRLDEMADSIRAKADRLAKPARKRGGDVITIVLKAED